jgi:hypothetical protein
VLGAQGNDELLVCLLLARLVEDAHVGLATVEGLGGLAQTAGESVVDESELEDTFEGLEHAHLALTGGCIGRDLDLGGRADLGLGIVFSVRLLKFILVMFLKCDAGSRRVLGASSATVGVELGLISRRKATYHDC